MRGSLSKSATYDVYDFSQVIFENEPMNFEERVPQ